MTDAIYDVVDDYDIHHAGVRIPADAPDVEAAIRAQLPDPPASKVAALAVLLNIPDWATWSEAEFLTWYDTNVDAPLAAATTLAQAKVVMQRMATVQRNTARALIAIRKHVWDR